MLLWLWLWPWSAAVPPVRPLAWELPYAAGATLKSKTNKQTNKQKKKKKRKLKLRVGKLFPQSRGCTFTWCLIITTCLLSVTPLPSSAGGGGADELETRACDSPLWHHST